MTVTTVNGGQSVVATFVVSAPLANGSVVGTAGGVVQNNGVTIGIPVGALNGDATISVNLLDQNALPFALPDGWNFGAALQINVGSTTLNEGLSLSLAAPAGAQVGDVFYIFQPGTLKPGGDAPDGAKYARMLMDKLVVGADGMLRTTSPPNIGLFNEQRRQRLLLCSRGASGAVAAGGELRTLLTSLFFALDDYATRLQTYKSAQAPALTGISTNQKGVVMSSRVRSLAWATGRRRPNLHRLLKPQLGDMMIPFGCDVPAELPLADALCDAAGSGDGGDGQCPGEPGYHVTSASPSWIRRGSSSKPSRHRS